MADCSWRTRCTNPDVRVFWAWCNGCGKRIKHTELPRCDYHRPMDADDVVCDCTPWPSWTSTEYFNPFAPSTSMADFLRAGPIPEDDDGGL